MPEPAAASPPEDKPSYPLAKAQIRARLDEILAEIAPKFGLTTFEAAYAAFDAACDATRDSLPPWPSNVPRRGR